MNNEFNAFNQYIVSKSVDDLENIMNGYGSSIDNDMLEWAINHLYTHEIASEYNITMDEALWLGINYHINNYNKKAV